MATRNWRTCCMYCVHWESFDDNSEGVCLRFPPALNLTDEPTWDDDYMISRTASPMTEWDDGCSEFQQAPLRQSKPVGLDLCDNDLY